MLASCALALPFANGALAAQAPAREAVEPPPTDDAGGEIGEIIVTAQKRAESLQDTPIAVTALGAEALNRSGVRDFSNITRIAPDVTVGLTTGSTVIGIRGVRAQNGGPTNESPAAVHLDGVFLSRPTGLNGLFYDIQRIEVLKGPQGTLYGRNAVAGVINVITNRPKLGDFGVDVTGEFANYDQRRLEGAVNLPLGDNLAFRFAGRYYRHDGYYDIGLDDADQKSARGSMLWHLSDRATLFASADYQINDRNGPGASIIEKRNRAATLTAAGTYTINGPLPDVILPADRYDSGVVGTTTADSIRQGNLFPFGLGPSQERQRTFGAQGQLDYELGGGIDWTTQIGYRRLRQNNRLLANSNPANPTSSPSYSFLPLFSNTSSVESRLSSNDVKSFQWVFGLYYFGEFTRATNCNPATVNSPAPAAQSNVGCTLDIRTVGARTRSGAAFGQATISPDSLDNRLHLILGARYNYDHKTADIQSTLFGATTNRFGLKVNSGRFTYKIGASYDVSDRNLLYANYSTGFKSGGFAYGSLPEFKPEYINAYEIGSKNQFFNRKLQINIDAYWYDYKNIQTNVTVPNPTPPFPPFLDLTVVSIGKARYKGVSGEAILAPTRADRIDFNLEYLDARYRDYVIPARFSNAPPLDTQGRPIGITAGVFSGLQIPNAPRLSGRAGYTHDFRLGGASLSPRVDVQFAGRTPMALAYKGTVQDYVRHSYAQVDFSLRFEPASKAFTITAYINNVTDKAIVNSAAWQTNGLITGTYQNPRTYGLIAEAHF